MGDQDNQLSDMWGSTVLSYLTVCVHFAKLAENITSIKNERFASLRALKCLHGSQGGISDALSPVSSSSTTQSYAPNVALYLFLP
jgi:hypothetical protein